MAEKNLKIFNSKFEKYDLIIADELGYISFERWNEIFKDPVLTAAQAKLVTYTVAYSDGTARYIRKSRNSK